MKKIEKNIYQVGPFSYQVKMMVSGMKMSKVLDTLDEARTWRDSHKVSAALDVHEAAIFESRIKKRGAKNFTFSDALDRYRKEKTPHKKGSASEECRLDKLARMSCAKKPLYTFKPDDVKDLLQEIKTTGTAAKGVKPRLLTDSTLKRYYNLIRHIFQVALDEWNKIDKNPAADLAVSARPKDGKPRDRRLEGDEYQRMLDALFGEARTIFILAVETAMRKGEILSMQWQHLKLSSVTPSVFIPETKNDESRTVPLSSRAVSALKEHSDAQPKKDEDGNVVKIRRGKVFAIGVMALRYQWRKARLAINAPNLQIHDLRHEAASRLIERGLNVIEAASVTGHKSLSMLKRYTHLHQADILKKLG
jgi:integrase